jgi:hypothetical protein
VEIILDWDDEVDDRREAKDQMLTSRDKVVIITEYTRRRELVEQEKAK